MLEERSGRSSAWQSTSKPKRFGTDGVAGSIPADPTISWESIHVKDKKKSEWAGSSAEEQRLDRPPVSRSNRLPPTIDLLQKEISGTVAQQAEERPRGSREVGGCNPPSSTKFSEKK